MSDPLAKPVYQRILALVRQIPAGRVATYGQIAWYEGHCTPRMVGYALAGLPDGSDVPWQRVINASGGVSPRPGSERQYALLAEEGIRFNVEGRVSFQRFGWAGPDPEWLEENGFSAGPPFVFSGE